MGEPKCCDEPSCERTTPVLVRHGGLTGRWYAITRHHRTDGRIVADVKHDITEELRASLILAGWTPPA